MRLTGEHANLAGYTYLENDEGWWMRTNEGTFTKPGPAPTNLKPSEKWIDVNLTTQTLVAFEGDKPVYATLVSSGKRDLQNAEKDHPTPKGSFRVREKHIAATMDGDVASDGPYSIEDVPWIMYFSGNYALHGAFWHSNFGRTKSHGCVNLSPVDAHRLFGWTDPQLPEGWHGVSASDQKPGTRVVVHD
jgi:lipoprotein-anchoring transpeptidase ErfK/SrfK